MPYGCNLWFPKELGGAGLLYLEGMEDYMTVNPEAWLRERKTAACLYNDHKRRLLRPMPDARKNVFSRMSTELKLRGIVEKCSEADPALSNEQLLGYYLTYLPCELPSLSEGALCKKELRAEIDQRSGALLPNGSPLLCSSIQEANLMMLRFNKKWSKWTESLCYSGVEPLGYDKILTFEEQYRLYAPSILPSGTRINRDPLWRMHVRMIMDVEEDWTPSFYGQCDSCELLLA